MTETGSVQLSSQFGSSLKKVIGCSILLITTNTGGVDPMTEIKNTMFFEMKLLEFQTAEDPMLAMLEWMPNQLIEHKVTHRRVINYY